MSRIIPNERTWVGFAASVGNKAAPTIGEVNGAVDITSFVVSITAATQGNQVPTPSFDTLFETTISGTVQSSFSIDLYRDDLTDTAWTALARSNSGFFIISRFQGAARIGAAAKPNQAGDKVEVWPVKITSRSMQATSSNQVQMFQVTCSVTSEPNESATVA